MRRHTHNEVMFLAAVAIVGLGTGNVSAQYVDISVTRTVPVTPPAIVGQRARMMDLAYRRANAQWHREAKNQRQANLRARLKLRLEAWRRVVEYRRKLRLQQRELYAHRIDRSAGYIDWPQILTTAYPLETNHLDDLFFRWAVGEGGVGSTNFRDITQSCHALRLRLKRDLKSRDRLSSREYIYLAHFIDELRATANSTPPVVAVAQDVTID